MERDMAQAAAALNDNDERATGADTNPGQLSDEHFVSIPETTLPDGTVVPAFKYGRYPASKGVDGAVAHSISAKPWVRIKFADAVAACDAAGLQLARETQELAVRHLICQQPENWSGGEVGRSEERRVGKECRSRW